MIFPHLWATPTPAVNGGFKEDAVSAQEAGAEAPNGGQTQDYTPPATQEELNRIIDKRLERERSKFADYSELQAKAEQFDQIEEASKTELQKAQDENDALAKELATIKQTQQINSWASEVAGEVGVSPALLRGSTREELLDHATAIKAELDSKAGQRPSPDVSKTPPALNSTALEDALRKAVGAS